MVKPEKLDHLHLVYHFTVPLTTNNKKLSIITNKRINKYEGTSSTFPLAEFIRNFL